MDVLSSKYSKHLEVLGNAERVRMIELLSERPMCVSEIQDNFYASQATVSYHLSQLKEIGFLRSEKVGKFVYYSIDVKQVKQYLKGFVKDFSLCLSAR